MQALRRSVWLRMSFLCLGMTFAFMIFFAAVPSALVSWSDDWGWVQGNELGGRIRDMLIVGYYGALTAATLVGFSLWQRLHPVNADADETKRDPGGYR